MRKYIEPALWSIVGIVFVGLIASTIYFSIKNEKHSDPELRHKYFLECLDHVPAGPTHTHYQGWDDVVHECESAAYYQSLR